MRTILILLFAGLVLSACSLFKPQDETDTVSEIATPRVTVTTLEPEITSNVSAESTDKSNIETEGDPLPAPANGVVKELEFVPITYWGADSLEERILYYPTIVKATLDRVTTETIEAGGQWTGKYVNIAKFHLTVSEYLNGSGGTSIIAVKGVPDTYDSLSDAETARQSLTDGRNTRWDDVEAIFFLKSEPWYIFNATKATDTYYTADGGDFEHDDFMSIGSRYVQLWLPRAPSSTPSSTGTGDDTRFLLEEPAEPATAQQGAGGAAGNATSTPPLIGYARAEPSTITLRDLKTKIAELNSEVDAGDGSEAYLRCVQNKYRMERWETYAKSEGREISRRTESTHTTTAGAPAGTIIYEIEQLGWYPDTKILTTWLDGEDAALFQVVDGPITLTEDRDGDGKISGGGDGIRYQQMLRNVRPLPGETYAFTIKDLTDVATPCNNVDSHEWAVTVTAPTGTLHEAFFDPVTVGTAIAADSTNGVLKPTAFTDANGASATIQSIAWESPSTGSGQSGTESQSGTGTVEMKLTPHTGLSNHVLDFIALDGSVILSLDADDATVDAANNTLSWPATYQPWNDGDKLMLRIHNGPVTPVPTPTPGPTPAAPTGLTATAGTGSVTLTWDNPSDSTITGYEYQMRWAGVAWQPWKAISGSGSSTTSHTVTGLTGGTEYRFHLRAVNANGPGTAAPNADPWYVAATPSVPPPAAPTGLTATAGRESVKLSWNNPSDSTITRYEYQARWTGVGWQSWKAIPNSGSGTTSHTVTGLTGGTEYRFHVRAVNASGAGPQAPNTPPWYVSATPGKR